MGICFPGAFCKGTTDLALEKPGPAPSGSVQRRLKAPHTADAWAPGCDGVHAAAVPRKPPPPRHERSLSQPVGYPTSCPVSMPPATAMDCAHT